VEKLIDFEKAQKKSGGRAWLGKPARRPARAIKGKTVAIVLVALSAVALVPGAIVRLTDNVVADGLAYTGSHLVFLAVGLVSMLLLWRFFDYEALKRHSAWFWCLVACAAVPLLLLIGFDFQRWITVAGVEVSIPRECFVLLGVLCFLIVLEEIPLQVGGGIATSLLAFVVLMALVAPFGFVAALFALCIATAVLVFANRKAHFLSRAGLGITIVLFITVFWVGVAVLFGMFYRGRGGFEAFVTTGNSDPLGAGWQIKQLTYWNSYSQLVGAPDAAPLHPFEEMSVLFFAEYPLVNMAVLYGRIISIAAILVLVAMAAFIVYALVVQAHTSGSSLMAMLGFMILAKAAAGILKNYALMPPTAILNIPLLGESGLSLVLSCVMLGIFASLVWRPAWGLAGKDRFDRWRKVSGRKAA
jgi:cell division protein FtsW (lipid II flippase)